MTGNDTRDTRTGSEARGTGDTRGSAVRRRAAGRRDVEKRWGDPASYRAPLSYAVTVICLALGLLAVFAILGGTNRALAIAVPGVLFAGGLGALGIGIRAYTRGRSWVPWQGAAWFLLILMLGSLRLVPLTG